ncbi:MAG: hypothetical protein V5A62_04675 [Haloarculaceae archaeon]
MQPLRATREPESTGPERGPTLRGRACVLVYTAAFVAVTLVGFAPLSCRVERPLQRALLRPAAWAGDRVDWAAHGWVDRFRRRFGSDPRFRSFTRAVLDDAISPADEAAGYVGTVTPPAVSDPCAWTERRLVEAGFHRNPTAYLEYRERGERQFEYSSWALRSSVDADRQLHVRLFDAGDRVDVYGHWEPSVTAGGDHYGRPDYRTGVAMALSVLDRSGVPYERSDDVGGVAPVPVDPWTGRATPLGAPAADD